MSPLSNLEVWPVPTPSEPIKCSVRVPGSKSLTNRYLVLAALASTPSTLHNPLIARDSQLMAAALTSLGTSIKTIVAPDTHQLSWHITPGATTTPADLDCGLAGTVMRFLPPVAALTGTSTRFFGDTAARKRPIAELLDGLRQCGVDVTSRSGGLPFTIAAPGGVRGGSVSIDASASSQFVSGMLLSAARFTNGIDLHHTGDSVPSQPHINMTLQALLDAGVMAEQCSPTHWRVEPGDFHGIEVNVEPDLSNAAAFLALAAATGGTVTVLDWPVHTTQAGAAMLDILTEFGAHVSRERNQVTVTGQNLNAVDLDLRAHGELTPVVAALCALASGTSTLSGIGHLRGHETDRLAALCTELSALGARVVESDTALQITGGSLQPGVFGTYHDHRMAQAGAILGAAVPGMSVENVRTTDKTLPGFADMWTACVRGDRISAPPQVDPLELSR